MWLRPAAYAKRYQVERRTVWRWIKAGNVKTKRTGATTFVWDGDAESPAQLDRIEKAAQDILHELRKNP